jgi:hypothetical protein
MPSVVHHIEWSRYGNHGLVVPKNAVDRKLLSGWAGPDVAEDARQKIGDRFQPFFIAGQTESGAGKSFRGWEPFSKVAGHGPDLTPQPTGNCVAAAADDVLEGEQCIQIVAGDRAKFHSIYNPYHYAYGRVIIGKNQLRGEAGSIGQWQARAIEEAGSIEIADGLPAYNKGNVDAWGDDRKADGQSFRDYLEKGKQHIIKTTSFVQTWELMRDALFNGYLCTIASSRAYTMMPDSGPKGFHRPSGTWHHQMSIWGYSEEGPERDWWVAIKNQWGDVHGHLVDIQTGEPWPFGFIRVRLADFIKSHLLLRGCEAIAYSGYEGFPEQRQKIKHAISW